MLFLTLGPRSQRWELRPEPCSPSAKAISYLSPKDQTTVNVSTATHLLPVLTLSSSKFSPGFSTFVLRLSDRPTFIGITASLAHTGVTAQGTPHHAVVSFVLMFPQVRSTFSVFVCLFLFLLLTVCCTLIAKSHMQEKKLMWSHLAKPQA